MFPRKYKKLSSFKRFILKLLNVYAVDRESLNLVNPNYNNNSGNNFSCSNMYMNSRPIF